MHVVKNVTESQTGTLFNIKGKTKDTWKSRQDLMDRGLKKSLHLQRRGESVGLPLVGNQEQRKINASGIQNNEEMVNPSRQNLKQKVGENQ
ncbi:hypothetical protein Tco_1241200, partial [Tanacetum coccineum]